MTSLPLQQDRPSVGSSNPAIMRSIVVLPDPDGPEQREELTGPHREIHLRDGGDGTESLADVDEFDVDRCLVPHGASLHTGPIRSQRPTIGPGLLDIGWFEREYSIPSIRPTPDGSGSTHRSPP